MEIINHPSILKAKNVIISSGCIPHRVVLRHIPESYEKYVTHMENLAYQDKNLVHSEFYWGHYFATLEAAEKDFESR